MNYQVEHMHTSKNVSRPISSVLHSLLFFKVHTISAICMVYECPSCFMTALLEYFIIQPDCSIREYPSVLLLTGTKFSVIFKIAKISTRN